MLLLLFCTSLHSAPKQVEFYANFPVDLHFLTQIVKDDEVTIIPGNLDRFAKKGKDRDLHKWVFWNLDHKARKLPLKNLSRKKLVLFMWEPPTVLPKMYEKKVQRAFSKIYTWDDDLVDGKKYHKFFYPSLQAMIDPLPSFEEKKLCAMVVGKHKSKHPEELYSLREKAIEFFESKGPEEFALFGRGWDSGYSSYQGAVEDKIETIKQFRFSICFENIRGKKGYITEKIFDCFAAGVVPVYLGASNIEDYVPKDCFIDMRDYPSFEALYPVLKEMSKETYEGYIERIKIFLKSERAALFSSEHFNQIFQEALR